MEKVICVGCSPVQINKIQKAANDLRIRVGIVDAVDSKCLVKQLLEQGGIATQQDVSDGESNATQSVLILFHELTGKHLDKILAKLRGTEVDTAYKCVTTPTNLDWTVGRLMAHLELERKQIQQ